MSWSFGQLTGIWTGEYEGVYGSHDNLGFFVNLYCQCMINNLINKDPMYKTVEECHVGRGPSKGWLRDEFRFINSKKVLKKLQDLHNSGDFSRSYEV